MTNLILITNAIHSVSLGVNCAFLRDRLKVLIFALACALCAVAPPARAVDPPPDGGYFNFNTAEGEESLLNEVNGSHNTALGYRALAQDTSGQFNTATGSEALFLNATGTDNTGIGNQALFSNTA